MRRHYITITLTALLFLLPGDLYSFDYTIYGRLLKKYLREGGTIDGTGLNTLDYRGLYREKQNPSSDYNRLIEQLRSFDPASLSGRNSRIAFWINAYNIGAIKMILDHYPVGSIRSFKISIFKNPWKKKILNIGGKSYSLHRIEHLILLGEYRELRSHLGIVCASVSCPDLSPSVYTGKNLNSLIMKQGQSFFANKKKGLRIEREKNRVSVSGIFSYDSKNFSRGRADIIPFILPFLTGEEDREYLKKGEYRIEFLPYNWNLNGR